MAIPESYSEKSLAVYMTSVLGSTGAALEWTVGDADAGSYAEAVNDTLIAYGVATIDLATDISKLRAIARWQVWVQVCDWLSTNQYDISTDGQSLTRSQRPEQAEKRLAYWEAKAAPYTSVYAVTAVPIIRVDDPFDGPIRYAALRNQ